MGFYVLFVQSLTAYFASYDIEEFGLKLSEGWQLLLRMFCIRYVCQCNPYAQLYILHARHNLITCSHTDVHTHGFLLSFMKSVADWYSNDGSPDIFFLDLLKLDVPSLFCNKMANFNDPSSLCSQFSTFLGCYYKRMREQCNFATLLEQILVCFLYCHLFYHTESMPYNECADSHLTLLFISGLGDVISVHYLNITLGLWCVD